MKHGHVHSIILIPCLAAALMLCAVRPASAQETPAEPDWLVPSLHSSGLLVAGRLVLTAIWPEPYADLDAEQAGRTFETSWSQPPEFDPGAEFFEWDHNPWPINVVGHGLMGSELYLVHRRAGHDPYVSLGMTFFWAWTWEYVIEAWFQQPSGIDLVWTPIGGLMIGEGRYQLYLAVRSMPPSTGRHVLFYLVDPLGQLERDLFGVGF